MLAAAYLALNQAGEGSSPSDPTRSGPPGTIAQDVGKPGNPPVSGTGKRGFKSHRPDSIAVEPVLVWAGAC